ncbi:hypothetical protein LIER_31366 [Lithospermum erythrorhizon]|uniref:C2H2-type domain-containing protein n=1 Tax=Lithospermum erythrorhizon TaxID=34254 RepID=A0AAV3RUB4_LITER
MEEDQETKHACKFCNKSFHSGRSLGGHMRTHLISSAEPDEKGHYAKKLPPLTNQQFNGEKKRIDHFNDFSNVGYSLRENPKKTNKFVKSSEDDTLLPKMICKECGKSFQSWKTLFGHMKFHSEKVSNNLEEDSIDSSDQKRSRRDEKISANSNVFNASSSSPCVSDIDQEPEEAAMSLLLLSRDYGMSTNRPKIKISEVQTIDISENCTANSTKMDSGNGFEVSKEINKIKENDEIQKMGNPRKGNSSKRKCIDLHDLKKQGNSFAEIEFSEGFVKKNSFECISCNRRFHSFQALGGHRASHRRIKGCFTSKIDSSEKSTETDLSPNQTAESSKVIKCIKEKFEKDHESRKSTKVHECPICFKVFPSGQALGGHKRSHLITDAKNNQSSVIQKSPKEERDFLDLNLPPPDEQESNDLVGFHKWWLPSSHKQTQLVGTL